MLIVIKSNTVMLKYDAVKVCRIPQYKKLFKLFFFCDTYWKVIFLFIVLLDHENIYIDTKFMVLEIPSDAKVCLFGMVALICIFMVL